MASIVCFEGHRHGVGMGASRKAYGMVLRTKDFNMRLSLRLWSVRPRYPRAQALLISDQDLRGMKFDNLLNADHVGFDTCKEGALST